jgi:hypothetical protein
MLGHLHPCPAIAMRSFHPPRPLTLPGCFTSKTAATSMQLIKSGYHFLIIIHLKNLTYALFLDINFDWWKQAERLTLNPV